MTRPWLVTGAGGMLGHDLMSVLGDEATGVARAGLDIRDRDAVRAAVAGRRVVVNAAAWTDVDGAEADEAAATEINGAAVAGLAGECARAGAALLHISTDYVFPGDATTPYAEGAPTEPVNAYGRSKLVGEHGVLAQGGCVVRTSWLYGVHGPNFVATMKRLSRERDEVTVVDDQRGQPTWSFALARRLRDLGDLIAAEKAPTGVYHGTAAGETTWYGLAREVFAGTGLDPERVRPTTSDKFPRPARRPAYSVLGHDRWAEAGLPPLGDWREALRAALPLIP